MRQLKSFLLILIALWLPLQAAVAVTMPFCRHAAETAGAVQAMPCHDQAVEPVPSSAAACDLDCDGCSICHLACSGFLLTAVSASSFPLTANVLVPKLQLASASHISEPPQQPPRR